MASLASTQPTAGSSHTGQADEAISSSTRGKAGQDNRPGNAAIKNGFSAADKRAFKQAGSKHGSGTAAGKVTSPSKHNDGKDKITPGKNDAKLDKNQNTASQRASSNIAMHPVDGLPPASTQPVDYFGLKGGIPSGQQQRRNDDDSQSYGNNEYDNEGDDDEIDGADADASIRPITPSSIDASSSFTGSTSLHSLAPTSRTFKSFRTGHSKTSASTKPTLLGANGTSISTPSAGNANAAASSSSPLSANAPVLNEASASPPTSLHSLNQHRRDGSISQSLTLQSDKQKEKEKAIEATIDAPNIASGSSLGIIDMHDPEANRIATSLHGAEGVIPSNPRSLRSSAEFSGSGHLQPSSIQQHMKPGPKASPLRNSFIGPVSGLATTPALSAAEEESESDSQFAPQGTPRDTEWESGKQDGANREEDHPDSLHLPEAHGAESSNVIRSSASITFSKLPPATPSSISSAQLYSAPGSPGRLSSYIRHNFDRDGDGEPKNEGNEESQEEGEGIYHYPRHSAPDPRNNPRASSPPPDNASILTLASSTGGRAPSVYTAASRYRDGIAGGSSSIGGAPSIVDTAGHRYRTTANEDASIRAIAPSRRESSDSIGSKWSAAILSQREGSYHAPHSSAGVAAAGHMADTTSDSASLKRKTPSLRTVATASSYYATPSIPTTELKA